MKTFKFLSKDELDTMVANFFETIGNLEAIQCPDFDETIDAVEVIGLRLRTEMPERGKLILAKLILDRAWTAN